MTIAYANCAGVSKLVFIFIDDSKYCDMTVLAIAIIVAAFIVRTGLDNIAAAIIYFKDENNDK